MTRPAVIILSVLTLVFAVLTVYFTLRKQMAFRVVIKTLASFCFLTLGMVSLLYAPLQGWFVYVLIGLLLGLLGDVFLALFSISEEKYGDPMNLFGLLFFLFGHVMYVVAFFEMAEGFNPWVLVLVPVLPVTVVIVEKTKLFNFGRAFIPAAVYSGVIGLMVASALNLMLEGGVFNTVIFVAAVFFVSSDTLLATYNFFRKHPAIMYAYMPLYYLAQLAFACALLI